MSDGKRSSLRALGRLVGYATIFVATLEVCARLDDAIKWGAPLVGPYAHAHLLVNDSLGLRNRPNTRYEKWRINSHGFRGDDIAIAKKSGVIRVGVIGASETFGLFESEGNEYPAQLKVVLDSVAPGRFEVVNFAVAGMSLPSMEPYYRRVVTRFQPDVVIVYPSPSFYLEVQPPISVDSLERLNATRRRPASQNEKLFQPRIVDKTRTMLKRFLPRSIQKWRNEQAVEAQRAPFGEDWVWPEVPRERVALFEKHLEQLVATIVESGADLALATHTNRFRKAADQLTDEDHHHLAAILKIFPRASLPIMAGVDTATNRVLRDVARRYEAPIIEIDGSIPASSEFFADYAHFTDTGARAMAELLAPAVLDLANGGRHAVQSASARVDPAHSEPHAKRPGLGH